MNPRLAFEVAIQTVFHRVGPPRIVPNRVALSHTPPSFVPDGVWFFVTICCERRWFNQLCVPEVSQGLLADAALYHRSRAWHLHLLLLMPDHLHAIVAFPMGTRMSESIRNWKRLTARRHQIDWQRYFFDHRIRAGENLANKATYIRQNPVRAGLVARAEGWPHQIEGWDLPVESTPGKGR